MCLVTTVMYHSKPTDPYENTTDMLESVWSQKTEILESSNLIQPQ